MSGILATKLRRPVIPLKRVERPHLVEELNEGLEAGRQVTLVSAPAGFGKTTCIGDWVTSLDGWPVAWLSLDPADDDPGRFFTYLVAALQLIDRSIGREIEGVLRAGQLPPSEVISTTLINDILAHDRRFLLVLDDCHLLQDPLILELLAEFVSNPPQPLHLVLLTREDPSLPLARLRANDQLTEIRAGDLRFNGSEVARFFNEVVALNLSEADIAVLEDRTEGWVAGLRLAAAALATAQSSRPVRDQASQSEFIARLRGSNRYILGYLTEEVLNRQPEDIQQFLLQTSILDGLSGDLCNAVRGDCDGKAGTRDAHDILEQLLAANLFIVPLDDDHRWYRYHHLFVDLLRDRQRAQPSDETAKLHRRACGWYAQAGMVDEAIHHALAAADYATAVNLIETHAVDMLMQWHVKTVEGWMRAIPAAWWAESPRANLAFAWLHILRGSPAQALPFVARLQGMFSESHSGDGDDASLRARWLALQSLLLNAQRRPAEGLARARQALEIAPDGDVHLRSLVHLGLAGAYQQLNDYDQAVQAFESIIQRSGTATNFVSELLGVSGLTLLAIERGHLHLAFQVASEGIERLERSGTLPPLSTALYGELGVIHYQWHQIDEAHRYFLRAIQVSTLSGYSDAEIYYDVILSRLHQIRGDLVSADREIKRAAELMEVDAPAAVREEAVAQLVRVHLAQGRLAQAEAVLQHHGFGHQQGFSYPDFGQGQISLEPGENMDRPACLLYLSALRILLHRARIRQEMARLAAGIELAGTLIAAAQHRQYLPLVLETLLLRAQMQAALGHDEARLADVAVALELGEPEGFITVFIEEGTVVGDALAVLLRQGRLGPAQADFARSILASFSLSRQPGVLRGGETEPGLPAHSSSGAEGTTVLLVEPLTDRELDVLQLMAAGLKYDEIAANLFISLNTVRSHVKAVYGKLAVNNRTRAIEVAHQLQILSDH